MCGIVWSFEQNLTNKGHRIRRMVLTLIGEDRKANAKSVCVRRKHIMWLHCSILVRDFDEGLDRGFDPLLRDTLHWVNVLHWNKGGEAHLRARGPVCAPIF